MTPNVPRASPAKDKATKTGSQEDNDEEHASRKGGRRGDPRMNVAVSALLDNPDLSLLEALRIGGFEYPDDGYINGAVLDKEGVSLAQRKNQLIRRRRYAQQSGRKPETGMDNQGGTAVAPGHVQLPFNICELPRLQPQNVTALGRGRKRSLSEFLPTEQVAAAVADRQLANARLAKFHPQYRPLFVPPASTAPSLTLPVPTWGTTAAEQDMIELARHHQRLPALADLARPQSIPPAVAFAADPLSSALAGIGGLSARPSAIHQALLNNSAYHPSGVAASSLNATASSVGLTLDQLAGALSRTPTLASVLSEERRPPEIPGRKEQEEVKEQDRSPEIKEQVALHLFQKESAPLYERSMILAGYEPHEAQHDSPAYKKFAFKAWSAERDRLERQFGRMRSAATASPAWLEDEEEEDDDEQDKKQKSRP